MCIRDRSTQSTGDEFEMAPKTTAPATKASTNGGINWKRQGIILMFSIAVAVYMVGRGAYDSKGVGRNAAPVSITTNLKTEIERTINMRAYELVDGVNNKGDAKLIVVKNTAKPPIVAAEFIYLSLIHISEPTRPY
eukprot:TRINITY_DN18234_c0_g1_i1.p1 TRINITY_DN18234_c0_g1~~TRINITY_DN18234_c0_g1_i1.p1  ORF type:complete len:136 (-),score=29.78 TRINITY_DN18234_c0_g1_i1:94-501(-)